jgi:TRAP-type C4-dicarboxylate transport system permease small subunit
MKLRSALRRVGAFLLDTVELYIPLLAFIGIFVTFNLAVFFRYVLNAPLKWTLEVQLMLFIWTVLLGGTYAWRTRRHVRFEMVYDAVGKRTKFAFRTISNILTLVVCVGSPWPAWVYLRDFMRQETTAAFGIPFSIVYFPIIPFFLVTGGHALYDLVLDLKAVKKETQR